MFRCLLCAIAAAMRRAANCIYTSANGCWSEAPRTTATHQGCGPAFLVPGVPAVRPFAKLRAYCETRNRAVLAPGGLAPIGAGVQAALGGQAAAQFRWNCGPLFRCMATENGLSGQRRIRGALEARVQNFSQNGRQVYATKPSWRAVHHLAVVPKAERVGDLGVRLLLRPDDHVSIGVRVFRDPARQPASSSRAGRALSNRRVDGTADCRMLRLRSQPATLFSCMIATAAMARSSARRSAYPAMPLGTSGVGTRRIVTLSPSQIPSTWQPKGSRLMWPTMPSPRRTHARKGAG
jgi:hypothetical protein